MNGIVSTSWLAQQSEDPNLLVLDTRPAADYAASHIPESVNIPFIVPECAWISYGPDELLLQLPADNDLFSHLSGAGVSISRRIVVSDTKGTPPYPHAQAMRVAMTLSVAGFPQVHVLNGDFAQWQAERRPVSTEVPTISPTGIITHFLQDQIAKSVEHPVRPDITTVLGGHFVIPLTWFAGAKGYNEIGLLNKWKHCCHLRGRPYYWIIFESPYILECAYPIDMFWGKKPRKQSAREMRD